MTEPASDPERAAANGIRLVCPVCHYPLAGLRELKCPECGAATTIEALRRAAGPPTLPNGLRHVAKIGLVITFVVTLNGAAGVLRHWNGGGGGTLAPSFKASVACLGIGVVALSFGWPALSNLERLFQRHEVLGWVGAYSTWIGAIAALVCLRHL